MNTRWLAYVSALFALLVFGFACSSGGEEERSPFFRVLDVSPDNGENEVPVEARIGFRIDLAIDPSSLTTETFFLTDETGAVVPSTVSVGDDASTAELRADAPLRVITSYTVTITEGLRSTGGATLEEAYDWKFTTLDSEWGVPEWLETLGTGNASRAEVVADGQLNALAVWQYTDALGDGIYANRYTRGGLWGDPERIDDGGGAATKPRLACDVAGNGFAVWEQSADGGPGSNIWTNHYDLDQGWGTSELLQVGEITRGRAPSVAADPAGNAIAVWVQRDITSGEEIVWARRFQAGSGWGPAGAIDDNPSLIAGNSTAVGIDASGNALAIWLRPTVGGDVIWANRYTSASDWGTAELIKPDPGTEVRDPRLAVGANGDAFVLWVQNEGTRRDVWAARFSSGNWESPERIDIYDDGSKQEPDIAVDGAGVAHAVWSQDDPDFLNLWARQYTPGSGWGAPALIESPREDPDEDGPVRNPRVGVNEAGNAFVVWAQVDSDWLSIWSNRLDPGTGWMTAEPIEADSRATAKLPVIAVDEDRHAHAIWLQTADTGLDSVRTNRFE